MKVKEGFVLRNMGAQSVVVATGDAAQDFKGVIRLNETGAFLWGLIANDDLTEDDLVTALLGEYDVAIGQARVDVSSFAHTVRNADLVVDDA